MNMRTTPRFSQTSYCPHFLPQTCLRRLSATIFSTTTLRFRYAFGRPSSRRSLLTYPRSSSYFIGRRSSGSGVINCTHATSGLRVSVWPSSASPAGGAQIQECSRTKSRTRLPQPAKTTGSGHSPDGSTSQSGRVRPRFRICTLALEFADIQRCRRRPPPSELHEERRSVLLPPELFEIQSFAVRPARAPSSHRDVP